MGGGISYGVPLFFKLHHHSKFLFSFFTGLEEEDKEEDDRTILLHLIFC